MKYAWIHQHSDSFPVSLMCKLLGVSRSGYYDSIGRPPSPRAERSAKIRAAVRQVFEEKHAIYGSFKIARELQEREDMESACRNTVAKAMREMKLKSRVRKSFTPTTTKADPSKKPAPNLLSRDFTVKWTPTLGPPEGWYFS